jgi:RNA polymerase sigma-70 factor, ECF subfamily
VGTATRASLRPIDGLRAHSDVLGAVGPTPREYVPAPRRIHAIDDPLITEAVRRAKAGDAEALRFFYLRYSNNVFRYVRTIVHTEDDAEDVTQQAFAKLITAIDRYEPGVSPFTAWMLRLAHNVAIDHLRTGRAVTSDDLVAAEEPAEDAEGSRLSDVRTALAMLPSEQRTVVVLRHLVGLSPCEIAERMGRSEASVHGLHHRARRALQLELRRLESAPCTCPQAAV